MDETSIPSTMRLDSLHADSLIWTNNSLPSENQLKSHETTILNHSANHHSHLGKNHFHNTHKDEILAFIKPDYGSLGEFITDINLSTDLLKQKKKKYDGQDEVQEKRIRQHLQNRNLHKVLCNSQSSFQQRSIACKLLIERSFQQAFGTNINDFYHDQIQSLEPEQKKSTLNIASLSDALDEIINRTHERVEEKPNRSFIFMKENMRKNRSYLKGTNEFMSEKENILKKLNAHKNNYRALQKLVIPEEPTAEYTELQEKHKKPQKSLFHHRHDSCSSTASNQQPQALFKSIDGKGFILTDKCLTMANLYEISNETILYIMSKINFSILQELSIVNTSFVSPDALLLLLDLIALESKNLKAFVIEDIHQILTPKIKEKLSQKIKNVLETANDSLKLMRLNRLDLETKDFCVICLGIGSSKRLEVVQFKNNKIDQAGKKSYDVITKFFKYLQINMEGNPLYKDISREKEKLRSQKNISK